MAQQFSAEIISRIRELSPQIEKEGRLPLEILEYIYEHKLFKLLLPESLNGADLTLPAAAEIFEKAAEIDGSFGWLVTIGCGGGFFAGYMQPEAAAKLYSPTNAVVAGSGAPTGTAEPVEGGYMVNGQWLYCSGAHHATIFTANCRVPAQENKPEGIMSFVFLPEEITVIEDWRTFGMKGTGSHSIKVKNVIVPENRTFRITEPPLQFGDHALFRFPFFQFAEVSFATVALGVARHFISEAFEMLEVNRQRRQDASPERYAFIRKKYDAAAAEFESARTAFYETLNQAWKEINDEESLSEYTRKMVEKTSKKAAQVALKAVHAMTPYLGMPAVTETHLLNRLFRDLHTVCQHTVLTSYED